MGEHVRSFLDDGYGDMEPEMIPIKYRVEVYDGEIDPVEVYQTYGGWNVEGAFVMVYDENGLKTGHLLPPCTMIKTAEIAPGSSRSEQLADKMIETVDLPTGELPRLEDDLAEPVGRTAAES